MRPIIVIMSIYLLFYIISASRYLTVYILCHVAQLNAGETVTIAVSSQEEEAAKLYRVMAVGSALVQV
jgi:hypothetical protein